MDQKKSAPAVEGQERAETQEKFIPETPNGLCSSERGKEHYSSVSK